MFSYKINHCVSYLHKTMDLYHEMIMQMQILVYKHKIHKVMWLATSVILLKMFNACCTFSITLKNVMIQTKLYHYQDGKKLGSEYYNFTYRGVGVVTPKKVKRFWYLFYSTAKLTLQLKIVHGCASHAFFRLEPTFF